MKFKTLCSLLAIGSITTVSGALSFSLQFSNAFGDGVLAGIGDEAGVVDSGLAWGILVAETGNDFSSPITTELGISTTEGSELVDGFRFFNGGVTTAIPVGTDPGAGVISASGTINATAFEPGVNTGDSFAVIWFERGFAAGNTLQAGDNYGILTNDNFLVPSNGASLAPFGGNFFGVDPVRSASLVVQAIPEPSSLFLASIASVALFKRRRS